MTNEEAIKIIRNEYLCVDKDCDIEKSCRKCPYAMPTKEPILEAYNMAIKALEQEPKTGHWIERHDDWGNGIITDRRYKCSVCHGKHIDTETGEWHEVFDYKYPFCPNCGAKMVEPQESEVSK